MKRASAVVFALLLLAAGASADWLSAGGERGGAEITILSHSNTGTTFEVTLPGVETTTEFADGHEFTRVEIPGEVFATLDEGRPELPKVSVLLAIPYGARVSTRVLDREAVTFQVGDLYPLQPPRTDIDVPGPLVHDEKFYAQDVSYPAQDVAVIETGVWRDYEVANLQVYPVRVNPAQGELEVVSRIRVRVDYTGGTYPDRIAEWLVPTYGRFIDNFTSLRFTPELDYSPGVRYLVFCHQNYATNSYLHDSLLGWVEKRGYEVRVITKSSFTAAEIKDSVKAEYDRNDPHLLHWVLLVGETNEVPQGSYSGVGASDYYYSDLEPWPAGDNYPEISIARLSPDSPGDLDNQIAKILKYQKDPPSTNNWLEKLTMVAHREQYPGKYSGCIRGIHGMPLPYYDFDRDTIMGQYQNNAAVTAEVNDGVGTIIYRGHGNTTVWSGWCGSDWSNSNVDALANGDLTPVSHHFACYCGEISDPTCHIEAWMRKYPGGAASAMSATQASYTYPNHGQCSTVVRAVGDTWTIDIPGVRDYSGPVFDVAGIMWYMDAYIAKYWPGSSYPNNIYMYLVLGDPSMPAWSGGMPVAADVTYPPMVPLGPYTLNVTVMAAGQPVENALVCARKDGEFYVSERTNGSGVAMLDIQAVSPGEFDVTVSEGHAQHSVGGATHTPILPFEGTGLASSGGMPYVTYLRHTIDDSAGGNGDGSINPGESIDMPTWIKNHGDSTARGVNATLRTSDGYVTITDSTHSFGDVAPHDSAYTGAPGFEFEVAVSCTNGHLIHFEMENRDQNDTIWNSNIYMRVGAPSLRYEAYGVVDTMGNGNGRPDPNETFELYVALKNVGFGHANDISAVLRSGDARMVVDDSSGYFGQIPAESTATNEGDMFIVTTLAMAPETPIPCTLYVTGAGGYTQTLDFEIMVGEIRAVDPIPDGPRQPALYWAYDDVDTFYLEHPEFEWVEVSGIGTYLDLSDDDVETVSLPGTFGPFVFYDQSYSQISVCGNGFVAPGYETYTSWTNQELPYASAPPMLGITWDDLYPPTGGGVWVYHDTTGHRFVVEWDSVAYYSPRDVFEKFQIVIYDTTMAAMDGNSEFVYQYLTANGFGSCTIGEQDQTKTICIQALYNGSYHRGSSTIVPGRAIKFTSDEPIVGITEPDVGPSGIPRALRLSVFPNPFRAASHLRWQLPVPGKVRLSVFDVTGRSVRTLVDAELVAGDYSTAWDGRDANGRLVANGTYLYKLETAAGVKTTKAVLLR